MKYTEIDKLVKDKFKEGENLKAEYKNGRIIIHMSKDNTQAPQWFQEFEKRNDKRWEENNKRLSSIESRLERIENTPTMKKELSEQGK